MPFSRHWKPRKWRKSAWTAARCRWKRSDLQRTDGVPDTEKGRREQQIRAYDITERRLTKAVEAGAAYIDLEIEAPAPMSKRLRKAAQENGTIVIRSYHDFDGTPSREKLAETAAQCREFGAEVIKIVTTARCAADAQTVLSLYDDFDRLIAFCMGEAGRHGPMDNRVHEKGPLRQLEAHFL